MNLISLERNIAELNKIENLASLIECFKRNYIIETIYCIPTSELSLEGLMDTISKNVVISVKSWRFEKVEYPSFIGHVNIFYGIFLSIYEKFERKIESVENMDDLKHELSVAREDLITLRNKHVLETRFSVLDDIKTYILIDNRFEFINLLQTDYVTKPENVLNAFRIRAEFFQELIVRISILLDKINNIVNEKPGITPKKATAQYLIYELVYALQHSDYFDIPDTEKEKLENSLFTLFNIKKRDKRSKVLGNINNNKSGLKHLNEIIPQKSVTLK